MLTDKETRQNELPDAEYVTLKINKELDANNREVSRYAFMKYDKEAKKEFVAHQSVSGYLFNIVLGDVKQFLTKNGNTFTVQNLYLELRSYNKNGELKRGVVVIKKDTKAFETIISKLANLNDFYKITIDCYKYIDRNKGIEIPTILIKDRDGNSLLKRINFRYKDSNVSQDNLIELPEIELVKDENDVPILTTDGKTQVDLRWTNKKKKIYLDTLEKIIEKHRVWLENNPLEQPQIKPQINISNEQPIDDMGEPEYMEEPEYILAE